METPSPRLLRTESEAEGVPSLLDEEVRAVYLEDEARAARAEGSGWEAWLRWDYRVFLRDYLHAHGVSGRDLAAWLDASPAFVAHLVKPSVEGTRLRVTCLRGPMLEKLLVGLELPEEEVRLFRLLVSLEAARRGGGDTGFFKRLIERVWLQETSYLPHDATVAYAREFLNMVLREMVALAGFRPDPAWIRGHLLYPLDRELSVSEVERTWQRLVGLELVSFQDGRWQLGPRDLTLSAGRAERQRVLRALFAQGQDAGKVALNLPVHQRQFESRTVCVPRDRLELLAMQFSDLLDGIEEAPQGEGEVVLHVQLVAFPVADVNGPVEVSPP